MGLTATLPIDHYSDRIDTQDTGQSLHPWYMTVTQGGCLIMSTVDNKVAKVRIQDSQIIFNKTVPGIMHPAGVPTLQDGWFVVSDWGTFSLHLVTPDGRWDRELWRHPYGSKSGDRLWGVSVRGGVCVAVSVEGETHVFDIS
ncbi:hypothetical protein RRG08_030560 [Elysia crispata]|uniref:Uncharacterized protein n=1 Tax=Elysia crispata TaxID=231223 RepID=A0AAE0YJT9_9GAST|nr:hypothetical protein RRG08_030560 [Elysia crispata]